MATYLKGDGKTIALKRKPRVNNPLIKAPIRDIAVTGLLLRFTKGSKAAAKTPRTIVIRYLGYLRTLAKNSPINNLKKDFNS